MPETRRREDRTASSTCGSLAGRFREKKNWGRQGAQKVLSLKDLLLRKMGEAAFCFRCTVTAEMCGLLAGWSSLRPGQAGMLEGEFRGSQLTRGAVARGDLSPAPVWQRQPRRFVDEQAWLASNKALFMDTEV